MKMHSNSYKIYLTLSQFWVKHDEKVQGHPLCVCVCVYE